MEVFIIYKNARLFYFVLNDMSGCETPSVLEDLGFSNFVNL